MKRLTLALSLLLAAASGEMRLVFGQDADKPVSLAAMTPADVGLCVEIRDLARHAQEFKSGELYRRLAAFPPLTRWAADNVAGMAHLSDELERRLGAGAGELWNGLLGRQVLVAVWPPERPGAEGPALLLLEASDPAMLKRVVDRLVVAQREAGKWKSTLSLPAGGRTLTVHSLESGQPGGELLLTTSGSVGIVATSESLLRRVAQQSAATDRSETLFGLPQYVAGMSQLAPQACVRGFVNPRRWDELLDSEAMKKPPSERNPEQQALLAAWHATEYAVFSVDFGPQVTVEGRLQWQQSALPESVQEVVASIGGAGEFWSRVPRGALVAIAGRLDAGRMLRRFGQARDPADKVAATLIGGLGPDYAAYIIPRDPGATPEGRPPADLVVGLDTRPLEPGANQPPLSELLGPVILAASNLAAATVNAESPGQASIKTESIDGVSVTSFSGAFFGARRWAVSYAIAGRSFWLATAPVAVARAAALDAADSLAAQEDVSAALERVGPPTDVLYVDLAGLRKMAQDWTTAVDDLAAMRGLDRAVAERSWRELTTLFKLADTLLAAVRVDDRGVSFSLGVQATQP